MAYAQPRSSNRELEQGMVDGSYKQVIKDRGGEVEQATWYARSDLSCIYYAIHEAPVMNTPDAQKMVSPYHTATPCPELGDDHSMAGVMMYGDR
jgi:hypothetical protein